MARDGVDALLLSVGPDLPWLIGYEAMPLERLTMLVLERDGAATLVVPRLERPRVIERPDAFSVRAWDETDDPMAIVAELLGGAATAAIGDRTWGRFVLEVQRARPDVALRSATSITGPLRAVKDDAEIAALARAGAAIDRVAVALQHGEIPLIGRTEAEVSAELSRRILAEGHHRVNFAIVAAGEDSASPHHEPGSRVIGPGEVVLCDFGGTMADDHGVGYCSDITRCVVTGSATDEQREVWDVLQRAQALGVAAGAAGVSCERVDVVTREPIAAAGYGDAFVHRTGHGIGVEEHEDPYIVAGNDEPLVVGNAYSVEPGIYLDGRWGFRLEDIVVVTSDGPRPLTVSDHALVEVEV